MTVLVDADIVGYRAAFSTEGMTPEDTEDKVDAIIEQILHATTFDGHPYELFLTGKGNFRKEIAVTAPYKGNRKGTTPPEFLGHARDHMVKHWGAVVSEGEEADDLISIRATELYPHAVIASVDKDFLQVAGTHYNTRSGEFRTVDHWEGLQFFYAQILEGDRADNIQGIYRVGPKKARKMLEGCTTEMELYNVCVEAYDGPERVLENGRLLWLRREKGQLWDPPEDLTESDNGP